MLRLALLAALSVLPIAVAFAGQPQGGIFIPRNGHYEGRIGRARALFGPDGGELTILGAGDWPNVQRLCTIRPVFTIRVPGRDAPITIQQSSDRAPQYQFLEEGHHRIGLRVNFRLYDDQHVYHGYGMTETWMYPNGELFMAVAVLFEDPPARQEIADVRLVLLTPGYREATLATATPETTRFDEVREPRAMPLTNEAFAGRFVALSSPDLPPLGIYWRTGTMQFNNFVYRDHKGSPTYYRWPSYLPQAFMGGIPPARLALDTRRGNSLQFLWTEQAADLKNPRAPTFASLLRFAVGADAARTASLVEAERQAAQFTLEGGLMHGNLGGYNDQEGAYEIRKTANPLRVILPAGPVGRRISLKIIGLTGHGAIVTTLDDRPLVPQLISEGGIADDPLAPIQEQPEGPADLVVLSIPLADKPQRLTVSEQDGVQIAYQNRDPWRNLAAFSTRTGPRYAAFRFSLADGRQRNFRMWGQPHWALTENLLHWFSFCGYTPEQMLNQLADFAILKNGPDEFVFRYTSTNANARAQSEFLVRMAAASPVPQINVKATFTVLESWPYNSNQFFDVFPFRGVYPQDWWYSEVLWLAPDGRIKWMNTLERTYEGDTKLEEFSGGGFFALAPSDRGNMVMLVKNFQPELPAKYVICGNYVDFHMEVLFKDADGRPTQPSKGFQCSVQYDLALWGDANTTREDLLELGKRSLAAGRLAIAER